MQHGEIGRLAVALAIASTLGACGGGGGGAGTNGAEQAQRIAITEANAGAVTAEAIDAGASGLAGQAGVLTGVEVTDAPLARAPFAAPLASAVRLALSVRPSAVLVGATFSKTLPCSGGGNVAVTASAASQNAPTPGDRIDFTFNACVESGATASGALSLSLISINGAQTLTVGDLTATQFMATRVGIAGRLNGVARITLDESDAAKSSLALSSSAITFERLSGGSVRATRSLTDYSYRVETTRATGSTAETFSYTASGSFPRIGNVSFSAQTTQPVITPAGAAFPSAGAGKVSGANGSNVIVTVLGDGLQLDVDRNGDNAIDVTLTRTWPQLDAEL